MLKPQDTPLADLAEIEITCDQASWISWYFAQPPELRPKRLGRCKLTKGLWIVRFHAPYPADLSIYHPLRPYTISITTAYNTERYFFL